MSAFLILVKLRLLDLWRRPAFAFFILGMPLLLLLLVGAMFANGHPFERRQISVASADMAIEPLARLPGVRVAREPSLDAALGSLRSRMTDAVLVREAAGEPPRVLVRPGDALFGRGLAGALAGEGAAPALTIVPASRWGYLHYLFPGMLVLAVVMTGLYGMGAAMVRYRATRFLRKLATTPLPRTTFVAAQLAARAVMVLAQALLMALGAHLAFDLPLSFTQLAWILALAGLGVLTFLGMGFALASAIRDEAGMQDIISAVAGPLVLLSEVFFSADALPGPLPAIAGALPSTILVRLIRAVVLQGETRAAALLPGVAVLTVWLVAAFVVSLLAFRWDDGRDTVS